MGYMGLIALYRLYPKHLFSYLMGNIHAGHKKFMEFRFRDSMTDWFGKTSETVHARSSVLSLGVPARGLLEHGLPVWGSGFRGTPRPAIVAIRLQGIRRLMLESKYILTIPLLQGGGGGPLKQSQSKIFCLGQNVLRTCWGATYEKFL